MSELNKIIIDKFKFGKYDAELCVISKELSDRKLGWVASLSIRDKANAVTGMFHKKEMFTTMEEAVNHCVEFRQSNMKHEINLAADKMNVDKSNFEGYKAPSRIRRIKAIPIIKGFELQIITTAYIFENFQSETVDILLRRTFSKYSTTLYSKIFHNLNDKNINCHEEAIKFFKKACMKLSNIETKELIGEYIEKSDPTFIKAIIATELDLF